jgi:hypothetical protein
VIVFEAMKVLVASERSVRDAMIGTNKAFSLKVETSFETMSEATLIVGLQATGTGCLADLIGMQNGSCFRIHLGVRRQSCRGGGLSLLIREILRDVCTLRKR